MKKLSRILVISLLIASIMVIGIQPVVNATGAGSSSSTQSSTQIDDLFSGGTATTTGITNVGKNIVSIITTIGIIVAVIVLLILGIKYMMGSASEKAEYKKTMIPYLVGAVLIFGASAIAKAVVSMSQSITA